MARIVAQGLFLVAFHKGGATVHRVPPDTTITVGRATNADVQIDQITLGRTHFSLRGGKRPTIQDLGSVNGTKVNRVRIAANTWLPLELGDLIEAGGIFFTLRDHDPHASFAAKPPETEQSALAIMRVVVEDPAMARLHQLVDMVARSAMPVLIVGETGVGKEIVSTAVHARSPRSEKPLVRINCAALPESLLESELFGFEKGAFTGAAQGKRGLIESAHGGSFFLDEIGEMPMPTQAKLLRVLESGEITRLGALKPRTIDVRFIAATNRHLPSLIAKGTFRRDLYYRLNGITIPIPPLRERVAEIATLARHFLAAGATRVSREPPDLSDEAVRVLEQHAWPGNIRELKNVMDRALTVSTGNMIETQHLLIDTEDVAQDDGRVSLMPASAPAIAPPPPAAPEEGTQPRGRTLKLDAETEKQLILNALAEAGGNQARAAEILGVSRRTLINRLDQYGVRRPRKR